jgi:hypothetical protein
MVGQWRLAQRRLAQLGQRLAQRVRRQAAWPLHAPPIFATRPTGSLQIGTPEIGRVVVQTTAFCNIDCSYCYLPDRNNKHVIAVETVERLFREIFASGWASRELTVVRLAGEPLVRRSPSIARPSRSSTGCGRRTWWSSVRPTESRTTTSTRTG